MPAHKTLGPLLVIALTLSGNLAFGLGFELSESKEQLKLKYEVEVVDHGTGRVTVVVTIADEGRLAPLGRGVDLVVPSQDGTGHVDLSLTLDRRQVEGKQVVRVHLLKELAERAEIQLKTDRLDGKIAPLTWYYHKIPVADYLKETEPKQK